MTFNARTASTLDFLEDPSLNDWLLDDGRHILLVAAHLTTFCWGPIDWEAKPAEQRHNPWLD